MAARVCAEGWQPGVKKFALRVAGPGVEVCVEVWQPGGERFALRVGSLVSRFALQVGSLAAIGLR